MAFFPNLPKTVTVLYVAVSWEFFLDTVCTVPTGFKKNMVFGGVERFGAV